MKGGWEWCFCIVCILKSEPFYCILNIYFLIYPDDLVLSISGDSNPPNTMRQVQGPSYDTICLLGIVHLQSQTGLPLRVVGHRHIK